jgi:hypothetical protein
MPASSLGCPLRGGIAKPLARSTRFAEPSFRSTVLCVGLARFQEASDVHLELLRTTQERRSQVRVPTGPPLDCRQAPDNAVTGPSQDRSEESLIVVSQSTLQREEQRQVPASCGSAPTGLRHGRMSPPFHAMVPEIGPSRRRSIPSRPRAG